MIPIHVHLGGHYYCMVLLGTRYFLYIKPISVCARPCIHVYSLRSYLAPSQFRDGLAIRYQRQPSCIPIKCNGCSANFTLQHGLDCKTGGLVIQLHNEVWDCLGDMVVQVWSQVVREPIVKEAESKADGPGLRADLGIRCVWTPPRWKRCLI